MQGSHDGAVAAGTVTLADGSELTFEADRAVLPAGLYERAASVDGMPVMSRTIQLPDGTAKGTSGGLSCDQLESSFENNMEVALDEDLPEATREASGNLAARRFRQAKWAGCPWVQEYLTH